MRTPQSLDAAVPYQCRCGFNGEAESIAAVSEGLIGLVPCPRCGARPSVKAALRASMFPAVLCAVFGAGLSCAALAAAGQNFPEAGAVVGGLALGAIGAAIGYRRKLQDAEFQVTVRRR